MLNVIESFQIQSSVMLNVITATIFPVTLLLPISPMHSCCFKIATAVLLFQLTGSVSLNCSDLKYFLNLLVPALFYLAASSQTN